MFLQFLAGLLAGLVTIPVLTPTRLSKDAWDREDEEECQWIRPGIDFISPDVDFLSESSRARNV